MLVLTIPLLLSCTSRDSNWSDHVKLEIEPPQTVRFKEPIAFKAKLTNTSSQTIEVHLAGPKWDFLVVRPIKSEIGYLPEREIWSMALTGGYLDILSTKTLSPNDSIECTYLWNQEGYDDYQLSPGDYVVIAFVMGLTDANEIKSAVILKTEPRSFSIENTSIATPQPSTSPLRCDR